MARNGRTMPLPAVLSRSANSTRCAAGGRPVQEVTARSRVEGMENLSGQPQRRQVLRRPACESEHRSVRVVGGGVTVTAGERQMGGVGVDDGGLRAARAEEP